MYNSLLVNIVIGAAICLSASQSSAQITHPTRLYDASQLVDEELYMHAIELNSNDSDGEILQADLTVQYPEWQSRLEQADKALLSAPVISDLLAQIAKKESYHDLLPNGYDAKSYALQMGADRKSAEALSFYAGYELLKKKEYQAALKEFDTAIKRRVPELAYAQYYSGLANLLIGEYDQSLKHLAAVPRHSVLTHYIPYYKAVNHYALSDYETIYRQYATRSLSPDGYNTDDLGRIIAYSAYLQGDYGLCLNRLVDVSNRTDTDKLLLAIIYNAQKDASLALGELRGINYSHQNKTTLRAEYEKGIAYSNSGQYDEAIKSFTQLLNTTSDIDPSTIQWNVAMTYARQNDMTMAIRSAQSITTGDLAHAAEQWISRQISAINDPAMLQQIANSANQQNKAAINNKLYRQAKNALAQSDWLKYSDILQTLESQQANTAQLAELYAIEGLQRQKSGNTSMASTALAKYNNISQHIDHLEIAPIAQYYLAYEHLSGENTKRALGHFSRAHSLIKRHQQYERSAIAEDILTRMADIAILSKKYKEAAQSYESAIAMSGKQQEYQLYQLSKLKAVLSEPYEQVFTLDQLIADYPTGRYIDQALYDRANAYFNLKKYDKANADYAAVLDRKSDQELVELSTMQIGLIHVNAGDYQSAADYYQKIIASSSNEARKDVAINALKEIYSDHEGDTEAYLTLHEQTSKSDDTDRVLWELAQESYHNDKSALCLEQIDKLISEYPSSQYISSAYQLKGDVLHSQQKIKEAVAAYTQYLDAQPKDADVAQSVLGMVYNDLQDYMLYESLSQKSWWINSSINQNQLAQAYIHTDKMDLAESKWQLLLAEGTASESLTTAILDEYAASRKWKKLSDALASKNIKLTPKRVYTMALSQMNQDLYEPALNTIMENQETLVNDSAWLVKGIILVSDIYFIQGDKESAIGALEGMLSSDIAVPPALKKQAEKRLNNLNLQ